MKNIDINELKNPNVFKVPDSYFDTLTERVMSKIPEEDSKVISINRDKKNIISMWKWSSVAACIAMAIVGTVYMSKTTGTQNEEIAERAYIDEQYQEDMMEYTMLDANDVYCYLSGDTY